MSFKRYLTPFVFGFKVKNNSGEVKQANEQKVKEKPEKPEMNKYFF